MKFFNTIAIIILFQIISNYQTFAYTYPANPDNYQSFISNLQPGDTLLLQSGNYLNGFRLSELHGLENKWIVIRSEQLHKAVLVGRDGNNTIDLKNCSYIKFEGFKFDGKHIPWIDAIGAHGTGNVFTHHIWVHNNYIVGHDGDRSDQQTCGISTKITSWDWTISNNIIEGAGTAIYLGNSDGSAPFIHGVIEFNLITNPLGYCMQIKHQNDRPSIAGIPTESTATIIRHNVFVKDGTPSPDGDRPNLLVGGQPLSGTGIDDRVEIYGNFLYGNPREFLFQGTGNISVHNNILVAAPIGALNFQKHNNRVPKELFVYNNTIFVMGDGINLSSADTSYKQIIYGNAIFSAKAIPVQYNTDNLTGTLADAKNYFNYPSVNIDSMDFYNKPDVSVAQLSLSKFSKDVHWNYDFNEFIQDGKNFGVYSGKGSNPGWKPAFKIKTIPNVVSVNENNTASELFIKSISMFPNPVANTTSLNFLITEKTNTDISIFDICGIKVSDVFSGQLDAGEQKLTISTENLQVGIYFLAIKANGRNQVLPFMKLSD